ncbi:MAG: lipid-A-disaccharide synthase [Fusobacteriaceae bacterium]|jgi:lipid-A-disaccharide synthase|nr:lipid-A-disaccharide synthase [Fusobacteriaceae bacterium]
MEQREAGQKFFVSTGETSGDLHLSYIVEAARKLDPEASFYGVAGVYGRKAGVKILQDIRDLAVMGFTEALRKYGFLKGKAREYLSFIKKEEIRKVILVDYGGFHLKFLALLKKELPEVKVYYYIPPKLWIWGKSRLKKLVLADRILVIFPWEVDFYKKQNVETVYYGNPFTEKYRVVENRGDQILLLPGSRKQEVTGLFPVQLAVVRQFPEKRFLLKLSEESHRTWIEQLTGGEKLPENLEITAEKSLEACVARCRVACCASGTVTLELCLMGIPAVVIYKVGLINAVIIRLFLSLGFVSLPNLTINREVYPELLQEKCTAENIGRELSELSDNPARQAKVTEDMAEVRAKLQNGNTHIVESYGAYILNH